MKVLAMHQVKQGRTPGVCRRSWVIDGGSDVLGRDFYIDLEYLGYVYRVVLGS